MIKLLDIPKINWCCSFCWFCFICVGVCQSQLLQKSFEVLLLISGGQNYMFWVVNCFSKYTMNSFACWDEATTTRDYNSLPVHPCTMHWQSPSRRDALTHEVLFLSCTWNTFSYSLHRQIATLNNDITWSITEMCCIILILVQDLKSVKSSGTKKMCTSFKNNV